jgi:hypothetical protein
VYPLGRNLNHDPRSRAFPFDTTGITIASVRHTRRVPVFDQGSIGSCTGNASTGCLATDPFYDTLPAGTVLDEAMAVRVYSDATVIDPFPGQYPPTDTGSDGVSVAKVLRARGLISGYTHTFSFDDALKALSTQPVITGTNWYDSMFTPDANGIVSITGGAPVGGHEYLLDEIDVERGLVGFTNSWGSGWGIEGRAYMTFDTLRRLLSEQGDVTAFVSVTKPAPVPTPPVPVDPTPVPPTPVPPMPEPTDADHALWDCVKGWATGRRYGLSRKIAGYLTAWAKAKGLH